MENKKFPSVLKHKREELVVVTKSLSDKVSRGCAMKTCLTCSRHKRNHEFYRDRGKADGRKNVCKQCDLIRHHGKPAHEINMKWGVPV